MSDPIYSTYADDEDMLELVEMFVEELPSRVSAVRDTYNSGDIEQLKMLAHQIKGSAGSYGFQVITEAGGVLEKNLNAGADAATIQGDVEALISLLQRATAAVNPAS